MTISIQPNEDGYLSNAPQTVAMPHCHDRETMNMSDGPFPPHKPEDTPRRRYM
ncbi:hypothetical protein ACRALDRAFT_205348 [Sodiomyces alcalophilus JCM 7366]|uniref:uncharacterized protein n=1 Tax=Sodiomyces alcalophilus JCM 7366 TaxID=591952 RepID=UPI0039B448D8